MDSFATLGSSCSHPARRQTSATPQGFSSNSQVYICITFSLVTDSLPVARLCIDTTLLFRLIVHGTCLTRVLCDAQGFTSVACHHCGNIVAGSSVTRVCCLWTRLGLLYDREGLCQMGLIPFLRTGIGSYGISLPASQVWFLFTNPSFDLQPTSLCQGLHFEDFHGFEQGSSGL